MDGWQGISPNEDGGHLFELVMDNAVAQLQLLLLPLLLHATSFFFLDFSVRLFRNSGGGRHTHFALSKPRQFLLFLKQCDDGLTAIGIGAPNAGRQTSKRNLCSPKAAIIYHFFFRLLLLLFLDSLTRLTRCDILSPKSLLIGQIPLQVPIPSKQPY